MSDPYLIPGTDVLRNKLGTRDPAVLQAFETTVSLARIGKLAETALDGHFDLAHLKAFHRYIFEDVYDWAGETRTVEIAKSFSFARWDRIEPEGAKLAAALKRSHYLVGMPRDDFVMALAEQYGHWNALHPFREGNGRATRAFFSLLTSRAGYALDSERIEKDAWNRASRRSHAGHDDELQSILARAVRHGIAFAFEKKPELSARRLYPELGPVFETLAKIKDEGGRALARARIQAQLEQEGTLLRKAPDIER